MTPFRKVNEGHWKTVRLSRNRPSISLFFADDVLLFAKVSNSQARTISDILNRFYMFYGLKVNVAKSNVSLSDIFKRSKMDLIISSTGIKQTITLEKCLCFCMFHGRLQRTNFEFIEEIISQRLSSWQHKLLNKVGHLILVRYVLKSIPNYYMQVAWLPQSTCDFIDKITINFYGKVIQSPVCFLLDGIKSLSPKSWVVLGSRKRERSIPYVGKDGLGSPSGL